MTEFLENLVDYITTLFNFIGSMVQNLFLLLMYVPATVAALSNTLSYLPPFLSVPIYACVCASLIIALLNKWG